MAETDENLDSVIADLVDEDEDEEVSEQEGTASPLEEMQAVHQAITKDVFDVLSVENSVASRTSYGGTAPDRVRDQVARWRARLSEPHSAT